MAKGFNKGPQMGGGGMMAQIQKMQQQLAEAQAKLAEETVTATAGGGAIKVVMTGDQKCQAVEINPDLLKDADAEMLQRHPRHRQLVVLDVAVVFVDGRLEVLT